jgi:hypothetical protein
MVLAGLKLSSYSDGGARPLAIHSIELGLVITDQAMGNGTSLARHKRTWLILN